MKNQTYLLLLLLVCAFAACKKESASPYTTTINTGSQPSNHANYKAWIILQKEDGQILHIKNITLNPNSLEQSYSTTDVLSDAICDVTLAFLEINTPHLSLYTYKRIPSGKILRSDIFATTVDPQSALWVEINILNMPDYDDFECVGSGSLLFQNQNPNLRVIGNPMKTGGMGTLVRWKAKGEQNYRSYWLDVSMSQPIPPLSFSLPAADFTLDMPKRLLQHPFPGDWATQVRGVTNSSGLAKFAYLASYNQEMEDPDFVDLEFEKPDNLSFKSYWVFAFNADTAKRVELEWLFDTTSPLVLPTADFKLNKFNLSSNGNINCDYEGEFDALHILVFGNAGKIGWQIEGAPEDLKKCQLLQFPDSLRQQWPALSDFTMGQTRCSEYSGLSGFSEYLDVDRSESMWRARLGFRGRWQHWHN